MEFDWNGSPAAGGTLATKEIEESFEDPFSIRIMPDGDERPAGETRYYILGRSVAGTPIFSVFWTDGKRYRVIASREMTEAEQALYERKNSEPSNW